MGSGDEQGKTDKDCLDECHAHHALCDGADGRGAEARKIGPALLAGKALEHGKAGALSLLAESHEDAGEDKGAEKGSRPPPKHPDEAKCRVSELANFRLQTLHAGSGRSSCAWPHRA